MEIFLVTTSYRELGTLFLFLFMGVLIFSSLVYVFENDNLDSSFATMLDAYWWVVLIAAAHYLPRLGGRWALITMTTVGYGDTYPTSSMGRLVGAGECYLALRSHVCYLPCPVCATFGVLVIALPIPIIGNQFTRSVSSKHKIYLFESPDFNTFKVTLWLGVRPPVICS